jgi:membrane fusion protein (multidrug efflux system)
MKKPILLTLLAALVVFGGLFGFKYWQFQQGMATRAAQGAMPAVTVSSAMAEAGPWPNTFRAIGSLASYRGITVQSETEGMVLRVAFESGATVGAGDLLVDIDDSIEAAQLPGLEAQARLAEINLNRARELRAAETNSPADVDTAEAVLAQTRAAVAQLKASLAKKKVTAPFAGRLGITEVHPGQILGKNTPIVQLEDLDPIHVDFSLPQQALAEVAVGQPVQVTVDALPDRVFAGEITAINPRVSETTRSLNLRATLSNPGEVLRPGMFAQVEVVLPATDHYLTLPATAILYNPYGNSVFVIEDGVAKQRFVQTGPARGDLIAVVSGLEAGEEVVVAGQLKLRNGSPVRVDNTQAPPADPNPQPIES